VTYLRKESPRVSNDSCEKSSWHSFVVIASRICNSRILVVKKEIPCISNALWKEN
jgi:hypothetical protein